MMTGRFLELDIWRGIAVLGMVIFHFVFDLAFFLKLDVNVYSGVWFWLARSVAGSFILLAGISIPLSLHRKKPVNEMDFLVRRGLFLLTLGVGITLVTYFLFPAYTIWFGVLHALGVFTLLSIPIWRNRIVTSMLGVVILGLGILFSLGTISGMPQWVGVFPLSFSTFDYFPLFPWLGVFLLGLSASHYWYPAGIPRVHFQWSPNIIVSFLVGCGRHSLRIYLVHQPILVGLILLISGIKLG